MKVTFHSNNLAERGTEIALFDYAFFNKEILGNESIILAPKDSDLFALEKFKNEFHVHLYDDFEIADEFLRKEGVDVLYAIKYGIKDHILSKHCKNAVHAVFTAKEPHGDFFAAISDFVAAQNPLKIPTVPHIVHLPEISGNLRKSLNIPDNAIVLGRHGGYDTFDLKFVHRTIKKVVKKRNDIYFIFMNTEPFYKSFFSKTHPQIIHLPKTTDRTRIREFINTCDAMIHARKRGETFGLSVGEFSICNKPILTWKNSKEDCHLDILKNKAITYKKSSDLFNTIMTLDKDTLTNNHWDCYSEIYNPQAVMKKFKEIFLS